MIKSLNKNDTLTSPYIATKNWQLSNTDDDNLILMEHSSSTICLEVLEYNQSQSFTGSVCSICSEEQVNDLANFREGEKSSGIFYPELEKTNLDGTFKRLVYSQIKEMFYNNYRDPTKMWGMENIDFDKSQTKKFIADLFRLYDIPHDVFGEKILENTVRVVDTTTDNDYLITDDGHGNLFAGPNLFAKQQEIGVFTNVFNVATSSNICNAYFNVATSPAIPNVPDVIYAYDATEPYWVPTQGIGGALTNQKMKYSVTFTTLNGDTNGVPAIGNYTNIPHFSSYNITINNTSMIDARVTSWKIWRTCNNGVGNLYLLTTLPIGQTLYHDVETDFAFSARAVTIMPTTNTAS